MKNFKKIKNLIMTKKTRLGGPLALVQKRRRSRNILRPLRQRGRATTLGQQQAKLHVGTMPPIKFEQAIDCSEAPQQGHPDLYIWDSSSEGSCPKMTTSRHEGRRRLTAKELETFDKEMYEFFKSYKSPVGAESS